MFNLAHILYMVISAVITIGLLVLCGIFVKQDKYKRLILKIAAILTVVLHYSAVYVDFFSTGTAIVESPLILPIYPCNIVMWLLVICAFLKKPESKVAKVLYEFTFYAGVVCGIIGIVLNENYANNPTLANWFSLKGLLSHSTMVFGCLYILVGRFIKIRVSNCISVFLGLCLFLVDGAIINGLYLACGLGKCNSMYLQAPPFANMPWLNTYVMGCMALILVFAITVVFEQCALKKEDRWYTLLKVKIDTFKEKKREKENKQ